ncbi:MAG TPA: hypothetical protein VFB60_26450 [Ktedonobacteraceae bacterium]|nr:hypothetical protein [Ktedonobacteraceae bacterium]
MVTLAAQKSLEDLPYEGDSFLDQLTRAQASMRFHPYARQQILRTFEPLRQTLDACHGLTLQERWQNFEQHIWPQWLAGQDRPAGKWWTGSVRVAVTARLVRLGAALSQ